MICALRRGLVASLLTNIASFGVSVSPVVAASQDPVQMIISAPTTTIVPEVELVVYGFANYPFDYLDLPLIYLTRNGIDVGGWYSVIQNGFYQPIAAGDGTLLTYRGQFGGLVPGANTVIARICMPNNPSVCAADTISINYLGDGTLPIRAIPLVEVAQSQTTRHLDACAGCASRTASYAMPATFVNGGTVAPLLYYSTELAKPVGLVEVDVRVPVSEIPERLSLSLYRNGSLVTLSNGATTAYIIGDTGDVRIAAQFDASSYATGAYLFDVYVRAHWNSGPVKTLADTLQARVLIQNETSSPYGVGWVVGGVPRIHTQADGVLTTDGSGGLSFFPLIGCSGSGPTEACAYTSPTGVYSTLNKAPASGTDSAVWHLRSVDGVALHFSSDGLLREITDRFGNSSHIDYQFPGAGPRIWKQIATVRTNGASNDRTNTFAYDSATGKLTAITLHDGRQSTFTVTSGDLVSVTDPDGVTGLTATYASNRIVSLSGRNGAADTVIFDSFGQVSEHRTPMVVTEMYGSIRISTLTTSLRAVLLTGQGTTITGAAAVATSAIAHSFELWTRTEQPRPTGPIRPAQPCAPRCGNRTEPRKLGGSAITPHTSRSFVRIPPKVK